MQAFLAKFYEAVIVAMAVFLLLALIGLGVQSWRATHYKTQLENAELNCNQEKADIHTDYQAKTIKAAKDYQEALAKQQSTINQLSSDYESKKAKYKVKVETVTREVQKIIDRPVYQQHCFDADGVSAINSLIANDSSEPP